MKCIPKWRFNFGLIYFACLNVQLRVKPIKSSDNLFARARKSDDDDGRWWFHSRGHTTSINENNVIVKPTLLPSVTIELIYINAVVN